MQTKFIKVQNKPLIWYVISSLIKSGIKEIIFPLGYKGNQIEKYVKQNFKKQLKNFKFFYTGSKTEIHARIKKISNFLISYDDFLLVNSDTIFDFNLRDLINFHKENRYLISLSGTQMESSWGTIVKIKKNLKKFVVNAQIKNYKIKNYNKLECFRNTGISIINFKCIKYFKKFNKNFEVSLYNKFVKQNKVGVKVFNKFWYPVETLKDLNILKTNNAKIKKIKLLKKKLKKV